MWVSRSRMLIARFAGTRSTRIAVANRDLGRGERGNVAADRIGQRELAFLHQRQDRDAGDRLGLRGDAEDRVRRHPRRRLPCRPSPRRARTRRGRPAARNRRRRRCGSRRRTAAALCRCARDARWTNRAAVAGGGAGWTGAFWAAVVPRTQRKGDRDECPHGQMVGCGHEPSKGSLVSVVLRARGHLRLRRRLLGHLVAPLDRARHVLVGAAHGDLCLRHPRRHRLRLPDSDDDVRTGRTAAGRQRRHLGPARAARRVHLGLGRRRDAGVGAVRQLVAQRLRAGRPDHQPAAHGARRRLLRHRDRHGDAAARVHEPRRSRSCGRRSSGCFSTSAARCCASRC